MKLYNKFSLLAIVFSILGCAFGRKAQLQGNMDLKNSISKVNSISIAVWDQRKQIIDASQKPDFVGYIRSGWNIPYPFHTKSDQNFVHILSTQLAKSFDKKRSSTTIIKTSKSDTKKEIKRELGKNGLRRGILIELNKMHADGYGKKHIIYDFTVSVFNAKRKLIVEENFEGKKLVNTPKPALKKFLNKYLPESLSELIEKKVFGTPKISKALEV